MPFCPICSSEYQEGVQTCPDCGVKLVPKLDPDKVTEKFRDAYTTKTTAIAEMIKEALEQEGIYCLLSNELGSAILPMAGESSEIKVLVPSNKLEEAHALIKSFFDESPDIATFTFCSNCNARVEADLDACPFCGEAFREEPE
jgi:hypothetical protein